jgi:glycosyltransferase involved in cell wall biosynthesis
VANYGLAAALLEYSSANRLYFFLPFARALKPFQDGYGQWLNLPHVRDRVVLLPAQALPGALERIDFTALHAAELDRYFPELCHLRNRWAKSPFPITCTPHTMNYWSTQVRNLYKILPGVQNFDAIMCTSKAAQTHLERSFEASAAALKSLGLSQAGFNGELRITPLGVRASNFGGQDRTQARKALGLPAEGFGILCLGRLTPEDKYDLMPILGAISLLAERYNIFLILAGAAKGSYAEELKQTAQEMGMGDRLFIFQDFDSAIKPNLYSASNLFVSPADNFQETFGLTLLEAMASKIPVLASDFSGYRDLITPGKTGFLIPTTGPSDYAPLDAAWPIQAEHVASLQAAARTAIDIDYLLKKISLLAESPDLCRKMGENGVKRVAQEFDWQVVVKKMEDVWQDLHEKAQNTNLPPRPLNVLGAGQGELFGHFTSRTISPEDSIKKGPLARAFAMGKWRKSPHPDLAQVLENRYLQKLLEIIEKAPNGLSLGEIQENIKIPWPPYQLEHLVLHGLKIGIFSLGE